MLKRIFVVSLAALISMSPIAVNAKTSSQLSKSSAVTTERWAVIAQGSGQGTASTSYTVTWSVSGGNAYHYFALLNQGSLTVRNLALTISQTRVGGNGAANEVFFEWCVNGIWNTTNNTCTGNIIALGSSVQSNITMANLNLLSGSSLQLRAVTAISGRNNFSTSISPVVSRGDVRAGSVRNS